MSHRARLFVALVSTGLIGYVAAGSLLGRVLGDSSYGQLAIFNEVIRLVLDSYVEPINVDRAMAGARLGMADALDGDSSYLDPEEYRLFQQKPPEDAAEVGLVLTRRVAFVMVVASRPGTPAEKAGLRPGDLVRSIDERHTRSMPAVVADRLLRGAPGSSVKLGILRAGADPFDVTLVRERVLPAAPTSRMVEPGTGLVRVSDFTPATAEDVRTELAALERAGAERLLLDLRAAAWGPNEEGARLAELFLPGGPVAKVVGRRAEDRLLEADPARTAWTKPLVVLVDNGTAGPGEIAAAALLDAGRGPLVGRRTFGRAAVSKAVPLPEGALLLTVAKYMSPKGTSIHGEGVQPTVAVASAREEDDEDRPEGEAAPDRVLEKGLEVVRAEVAKARG